LNPGRQRGRTDYEAYSLKRGQNRVELVEYLQSKSHNERYVKSLLSYLDKNFTVIREPMDVVRIFAKLSSVGSSTILTEACETFLILAS
jgi:hypothetical protein